MKTMKTRITIIRSVVALVGAAGRNFLSVKFMKTNLAKANIKTRHDREPISNGRLTVRKTQTERAAMKPATPTTLRPANGGTAARPFSLACSNFEQVVSKASIQNWTRDHYVCSFTWRPRFKKKGTMHNTTMAATMLVALCLCTGPNRLQAQRVYEPYTFTHFAGSLGGRGYSDGTGSAVRLDDPSGVATDAAGNVYVADARNHTIRKITPGGMPAGRLRC